MIRSSTPEPPDVPGALDWRRSRIRFLIAITFAQLSDTQKLPAIVLDTWNPTYAYSIARAYTVRGIDGHLNRFLLATTMAQDLQREPVGEVAVVPATPPPQLQSVVDEVRSPSKSVKQQQAQTLSATPPRSSQVATAQRDDDTATSHHLATPTTTRRNASKDLPSVEHIEHAGIDELRNMVKSLVNDLTDARIGAANARLQHHFLLLQTSQAAERAEVESQLSRKQVDFLRVKQIKPHLSRSPPAVQPPSGTDSTLAHDLRHLEQHNEALDELCEQLKREKELQAERIQSLSEHNSLLVNRIRENREHFTKLRERSPMFPTPRQTYTTPRRRRYSRYQDDTPFAALIAADQILSQEVASVPATPTRSHATRVKHGHKRGAHSLSSVQTPKDRPSTSDGFLGSQLLLSAPASQLVNESAERERHDRDSTISVSDDGRRAEWEGLTQSQASSLATDMLRRNPSGFESPLRQSQEAEKSSNLLQSKLFGNVKKGSQESATAKLKRAYGYVDHSSKTKKIRTQDKVGLGIEA